MHRDWFAEREAQQSQERKIWEECTSFYGESYRKKLKTPSKKPNLTCAYCGKTYGEKDVKRHSEKYALGAPVKPYNGNLMIAEEWLGVGPNMGPNNSPGARVDRYLWDGETYRSPSGTEPFCTIKCAKNFGISAYRAGYRITKDDRK